MTKRRNLPFKPAAPSAPGPPKHGATADGPAILIPGNKPGVSMLAIRAEALPQPEKVYDADFAWVRPRLGAISLFFGKGDPGTLRSRVEVRMSPDRFYNFWKTTQNGFEAEAKRIVEGWPAIDISGEVGDPGGYKLESDRDHSEWASVCSVTRTGGMGTMDFFFIAPREIIRAREVSGRANVEVVPVLRVILGLGVLSKLLTEVSVLAKNVGDQLPEDEKQ